MRLVVRRLILAPLVFLAAAAGCSAPEFPKTYPLRGTVLLPGGAPLQGGRVEFESVDDPNFRALGELEKDGTFARVYTYKSNGREVQGVIAGEHRVRIDLPTQDEDEGGERDPGEAPAGPPGRPRKPPLVAGRYRAFDTSGLKITVPAPDNRITIELKATGR